jgi:YHS domain-containing protein
MKTRIAILVTGILFLGFVSCNTKNKQKAETKVEIEKTVVKETNSAKLASSKVCFVNNKFMGIDQIPVEFEGKTYYGCCKDCVGKLQNIREIRYAKDPLTGAEVDKALAYIVIAPQGNNDVLYFESEDNYLKFNK